MFDSRRRAAPLPTLQKSRTHLDTGQRVIWACARTREILPSSNAGPPQSYATEHIFPFAPRMDARDALIDEWLINIGPCSRKGARWANPSTFNSRSPKRTPMMSFLGSLLKRMAPRNALWEVCAEIMCQSPLMDRCRNTHCRPTRTVCRVCWPYNAMIPLAFKSEKIFPFKLFVGRTHSPSRALPCAL